MPKSSMLHWNRHAVAVLVLCWLAGCGGGRSSDQIATVDGKVTYQKKPVPSGSKVVIEDKTNGVTMLFDVGDDGKFSVPESSKLPAGKYAVAVTPPSSASTGADDPNYDKMMSAAKVDGSANSKKDDYPVPQKFRSTKTSGKTIDVKAGSQSVEIDFDK